MKTVSAFRILVDTSIESLTDTMQCVTKFVETLILGKPQTFRVLAFERRPTLSASHVWKNAQLNCLPTIARLAREGTFEFFTYSELCNEAWKRPGSFPADPIGMLFSDIIRRELAPPVERSRYFQLPLEEYITNECMVRFCKWLLDTDFRKLTDYPQDPTRYPSFEIENLRNVARYRALCQGLGDHQLVDAFHIWTAEVHGLSYFLTTDRKFIRAITAPKRLHLSCPPISPQDLLETLGIADLDPFPYEHGATIDIFGQPVNEYCRHD